MSKPDYKSICFVVMPFGRKPVGEGTSNAREVDFDKIYREVFEPAIRNVSLPEGGKLVPFRMDDAKFAGLIDSEMYAYIEYSRVVLGDISSKNLNVGYELGVRHRARSSGTVIFRQTDVPNPFDIQMVRSFPYEFQPDLKAAESRTLIAEVLTNSLIRQAKDSPVLDAIGEQREKTEHNPALELLLRNAEQCLKSHDRAAAATNYENAIRDHDAGPLIRQRVAVLYRDMEAWKRAIPHLQAIIAALPTYGEAYRELGIAQNKVYSAAARKGATDLPTGETALRRAIELSPTDYDAYAALGGLLRRSGKFSEALVMYGEATEISMGHPYPLLNEIKLEAMEAGKLVLDPRRLQQLQLAGRMRQAQTEDRPPSDSPWCFFDLAEIRFYQADYAGFDEMVRKGIGASTASWQPRTFGDALEPLMAADLGALDKDKLTSVRAQLLQ